MKENSPPLHPGARGGAENFEDPLFLKTSRKFGNILLMVQKSGEKTTWDGAKTLGNNGMNYQPQLVIAGFLNHQQ